ncbi:MAG: ADP-ribosylglycohydrolase family protein [Opitutales bacterium]
MHFHQFLPAGDNTINYLLGIQLYRSTVRSGAYDPDTWLEIYITCMQRPGWHRDTYLEEYHRAFFDNLAKGKALRECGIKDIHIGGLAHLPCLIAALYLACKYADDFSAGILVNARCGGDNCHRGAVVGALLAAANGIPEHWLDDLKSMERLRCDTLDGLF